MGIDPAKLSPEEIEELATLQHYAAIGHVAANWGYFEMVIDSWSLVFAQIHPQPGACLTSQIAGHSRKLDAFISIARLSRPTHKYGEELDKFCKDATGLAEQRNRAVHDHWDTTDITNPRRMEVSARRRLKMASITVPTEEILKLALNISDLTDRFDNLASQISLVPRPSPEKSPSGPVP